MISGLFETHIEVSNLENAMEFYGLLPGLTLALIEEKRRIGFYWINGPGNGMLGLWEKPTVHKQHFAFRCEASWILEKAANFLKSRNLRPYNFLKDGKETPMVFAWMPAIAIYFDDPDGNVLEFISMLPGDAMPEKGIITYDEWSLTR